MCAPTRAGNTTNHFRGPLGVVRPARACSRLRRAMSGLEIYDRWTLDMKLGVPFEMHDAQMIAVGMCWVQVQFLLVSQIRFVSLSILCT